MDINNHDGFVCELMSIIRSTSCFDPTIPSFPALAAPAPSPLSKPTRTVASLARHTYFIFVLTKFSERRGACVVLERKILRPDLGLECGSRDWFKFLKKGA